MKTPLTPEGQAFVNNASVNNIVANYTEQELFQKLRESLQIAVQIELSTIPIYLYTYYSVNRTRNIAECIRPLDLYANKVGSHIMSVAVEEMLHLSLSSNIYFALFGEPPEIYGRSPTRYPTPLPHHKRRNAQGELVEIPLAKLSHEQLWHFLEIEYPEPTDAEPQEDNWETIGQFYAYIRCLVADERVTDEHFQKGADEYQIQPYNYSPSSIDAVHPKQRFKLGVRPAEEGSAASVAAYSNVSTGSESNEESDANPHSQGAFDTLILVNSKASALQAIASICEQGEGSNHSAYDDRNRQEYSHYYKFLLLQSELSEYNQDDGRLPRQPEPPPKSANPFTPDELRQVLHDLPDNPTTAAYAEADEGAAAISDLCNAVYQYMLIMTESTFKVQADHSLSEQQQAQKRYFNKSMHLSMIWILDTICSHMVKTTIKGRTLAPTFEFYDLGEYHQAYRNLLGVLEVAVKNNPCQTWLPTVYERIKMLPDVASLWGGEVERGDSNSPFAMVPQFATQIGNQPKGSVPHACMGLNHCKAQDRYGIDGPDRGERRGQANECAGKGLCATTSIHTCHVMNDCRNQGGCGLYGNGEEMSQPGVNECRGLGSCAVPIVAERFITDGKYVGESVWERARAAFHEKVWPEIRERASQEGEILPAALPPAGNTDAEQKVFEHGPPYFWIASNPAIGADDIYSCGSNGMSGTNLPQDCLPEDD